MAVYALTDRSEIRVLQVAGPLVQSDAKTFRAELERLSDAPRASTFIVDLSGLERICSAAMRLLVQCERALAKAGARMVTVGLKGIVRETVEMCGIHTLLTTAPSVEAAVNLPEGAA